RRARLPGRASRPARRRPLTPGEGTRSDLRRRALLVKAEADAERDAGGVAADHVTRGRAVAETEAGRRVGDIRLPEILANEQPRAQRKVAVAAEHLGPAQARPDVVEPGLVGARRAEQRPTDVREAFLSHL